MSVLDTEQVRRTMDARENLGKTIALFYTKYIPDSDDGNLMSYTRRRLTTGELDELQFRNGKLMTELSVKRGSITRMDLLKAQIGDIVVTYAEDFRMTNAAIPHVMRLRFDADIDAIAISTTMELYAAMDTGFIQGRSANWHIEIAQTIFNKQSRKLNGVISAQYEDVMVFLCLKGYETAGYDRFRFMLNETDDTCEVCLSHEA